MSCVITNGNLNLSQQQRAELTAFRKKNDGKRIRLSFRVDKSKTTRQLAYYFGVVIPHFKAVFKESGNIFDDDQVHNLLKLKFFSKQICVCGKYATVIGTLSTATIEEMKQFIDNLNYFSIDWFGCPLPEIRTNV